MNTHTESFWPADIGVASIITPIVILREQASILANKTKGLVEGRVVTRSGNEGVLRHSFELVAPALGGYRYELFRVSHSVLLYPVTVEADSTVSDGDLISLTSLQAQVVETLRRLNDEAEFKGWLKKTLSSKHTRFVIDSLIAQSVEPS